VTMRFFVRDPFTMIAAPVQCDVDGIPKGSHTPSVPQAMPFEVDGSLSRPPVNGYIVSRTKRGWCRCVRSWCLQS
jgi:hypothetical protein